MAERDGDEAVPMAPEDARTLVGILRRIDQSGGCPRCRGVGWVCERHRRKPMEHLVRGTKCMGAGKPCEEPGCPFRTHLTDAEELQLRRVPGGRRR